MAQVTVGSIGGVMTAAQLKAALDAALTADLTRQGSTNSRTYRCVDNLVLQGDVNAEGFTFICAPGKIVTFIGSAASPAILRTSTYVDGVPFLPIRIVCEGETPYGEHDTTQETQGFLRNCGMDVGRLEIVITGDTTSNYFGVPFLTAQKVVIRELVISNQNQSGLCYTTLNLTHAQSAVRISSLRNSTLRLSSTFDFGFVGDSGWAFGEQGTQDIKLLSPDLGRIVGFAPKFLTAAGTVQLANPSIGTNSTRIFKDSFIDPSRVTMYPTGNDATGADIERTVTYKPQAPDGAALAGVTARVLSARTITGSPGVTAGATILQNSSVATGGAQVLRVWRGFNGGGGAGAYQPATKIIDDNALTIDYRLCGRIGAQVSLSGYLGPATATAGLAVDSDFTGTAAQAAAITGVAFVYDAATGTVAVTTTAAVTAQQIYNYWSYWTALSAQMGATLVPMGLVTVNNGALTIVGSLAAGAALSGGGAVTSITATTITGAANITCLYTSSAGQSARLTVPGLVGASVYVADGAGVQVDFASGVTGSRVVYFAPGLSGTYSWVVERLGYKRQSGTFTPGVGGDFAAALTWIPDATLTVTDAVTLAAYTTLDTPTQLLDYTAYWRTTSAGIAVDKISKNGSMADLGSASLDLSSAALVPLAYAAGSNKFTLATSAFVPGALQGVLTTGTVTALSGVAVSALVEDSAGVRVTVTKQGGGSYNILARHRAGSGSYTSLGFASGVSTVTYIVPRGDTIEIVMWSLGCVTYSRVISTANGGTGFAAEMTVNPAINTTLDVSSYLADIALSLDTTGATPKFVITFNAAVVVAGIELGKAIIHRLSGLQVALAAGLPPGVTSAIAISPDEILNNLPSVRLDLGSSLTVTDRVYLDFFINTVPALVVDSAYVINPPRADGNQVQILRAKPALDASILAAQSATAVRAILAPELARIDVATSTRSTLTTAQIPAGLTVAQIEASPVLSKAAAVTQVAAQITALATAVGTPMQAASYTAPDNAGIAAIKAKTDTLINTDTSSLATTAQLAVVNANVATRSTLTAADIPAGLTAAQVRAELSVELGRIDVATSSRSTLAVAQIPAGLTVAQIEASTVLAKEATVAAKASQASVTALAIAVGTPMQAASYTAPDNAGITSIKVKTDTLVNTDTSSLATTAQLAVVNANVATRSTLTAADIPAGLTAAQVRAELSVELGRIDVATSTRLGISAYTAPPTPPTAALIATAVRTNLSIELARINKPLTDLSTLKVSDLPAGLTPLQATQLADTAAAAQTTNAAVLALRNTDTSLLATTAQLAALGTPTAVAAAVQQAIAPQLSMIDVHVLTRSTLTAADLGQALAADIANLVVNAPIEAGATLKGSLRLMNSALAGQVRGAGSNIEKFSNLAGTKNVIVSTNDANGNRRSVTTDLTD